jgi:NTE family protein
MVIKTYPKGCSDQPPPWLQKAHNNPHAAPLLKAFADALYSYQDGSTKYVKLLDGGLVDNFGLSGFTISRLSATTAHEPLTPEQAVRLKRSIVILVDAGRAPSGDCAEGLRDRAAWSWSMPRRHRRPGQRPLELHRVRARDGGLAAAGHCLALRPVAGAAQALSRAGQLELPRHQIHGHSRGLRSAQSERAKMLSAVDTRLKLPVNQVDAVIAAGRDSLRVNPTFRDFLKGLGGRACAAAGRAEEPPSTPVAVAGRAGHPPRPRSPRRSSA